MRFLPLAAAAVCLLTASLVQAQTSVGINFYRDYAPSEPGLAPTDTAGVVPQQNWNNLGAGASANSAPRANSLALVDNLGNSTGATANFTAGKIDLFPANASTPDASLYHGYLDARTTNGITYKPSVTVSGLNTAQFLTYDVYVYYSTNTNENHNNTAFYNLTYDTTSQAFYGNHAPSDNTFNGFTGTYQDGQSLTYGGAGETGNYLVFHDVTGSSFTLDATGVLSGGVLSNGATAPINAIQIVSVTSAVPEPGTLALLASFGFTSAGFLARRRNQARKAA